MDKFDYMKYALSLAKQSAEEGEVPVGAIVVCDGKIVGEGRNRREVVKNALHHAEIEAAKELAHRKKIVDSKDNIFKRDWF